MRQTAGLITLPLINNSAYSASIDVNKPRHLSFYHTHTGKNLSLTYHDGYSHIPNHLSKINQFLADFRSKEIYPIDPNLLDMLYLLQQITGIDNHYEIISAYRSPQTNAKLRSKSNQVAKRSLHMQGKAIDVRLVGMNTKKLRQLAMNMKLGGVGYYRRSNFIHLDTGRVRYW
jgi:uncharacterized protein YcbK (DUF882 family)